ncbi:hypothetical protein [Vibrio navarrensis]|uniref:hypothetical protein n=1 Tax=Vibrio navarrensis TaxID=29495 RepID=UPI001868B11E|nr:hypothetical protein [Vibrio navarrensis]MBE3654829.1 hypothetical protein [Vibrio navarrensis]
MIEAVIGLVGVIVGALVTGLKDWITSYLSKKARKKYLATRVVSMLEIFVDNCALVLSDDGTVCGQPDKDGYYYPQVKTPTFEPLLLDVDWLSIDANLMHKILYLPNEVYMADSKIQSIWDYNPNHPEHPEIFEERYYQYSRLAIKANEIISELCKESGIKISEEHKWFDADLFVNKFKLIEEQRKKAFT